MNSWYFSLVYFVPYLLNDYVVLAIVEILKQLSITYYFNYNSSIKK